MHQRANGLGPQDDLIAFFDVLKFRGQRAVLNLDRIEFQFFVPRGRGDGIGAQERFLLAGLGVGIAHEADHDEFTGPKPERGRTGAGKGEKPVGIVFDPGDGLGVGQGRGLGGCGRLCVGHVGIAHSLCCNEGCKILALPIRLFRVLKIHLTDCFDLAQVFHRRVF